MDNSIELIVAEATPVEGIATQAAKPKSDNPLLKLDPGVSIWAWVTFIILLLILRKFAWGPISNSLDERDKFIKSSMEAAEQARNESKKIADDQKSILAEAKTEASQLVAEAKKIAEEFKRKIEASALVEKGQILDSAKAEISNLKDQAIQELKSTVVDLAIGATEKLLDEKLDSENSKALVNKYIEKVEA